MKSEDFKELQEFCDQKGYQLLNESLEDNTKFFVVSKKKDEWEGVEFAECINHSDYKVGIIYRTDSEIKTFINCFKSDSLECFKPSTEQAYVDQLKAKAFELYGEIKEGGIFKHDSRYIKNICGKDGDSCYLKDSDELFILGSLIYKKGKWAKKIEKVKVEWVATSITNITFSYNNSNTNLVHRGYELAEVLETYLNSDQK